MIICTRPGQGRQLRDLQTLRLKPEAAATMSRARRRAAARLAWHILARRPGETWPDFWRAV